MGSQITNDDCPSHNFAIDKLVALPRDQQNDTD